MVPEGLSLSDSYRQPSGASGQHSGACMQQHKEINLALPTTSDSPGVLPVDSSRALVYIHDVCAQSTATDGVSSVCPDSSRRPRADADGGQAAGAVPQRRLAGGAAWRRRLIAAAAAGRRRQQRGRRGQPDHAADAGARRKRGGALLLPFLSRVIFKSFLCLASSSSVKFEAVGGSCAAATIMQAMACITPCVPSHQHRMSS